LKRKGGTKTRSQGKRVYARVSKEWSDGGGKKANGVPDLRLIGKGFARGVTKNPGW